MSNPSLIIPEDGIVRGLGLVRGLSNADYHARPELSKSRLPDFMVVPANYYGLYLDPNRPPSSAETIGQRAGTLLHTLALEPETFDERYAIGPSVNRNTKEWKSFEASLPQGVTALKSGEYNEGRMQAESLRRHSEIGELLSSGFAEASIFWVDAETGVRCRCRPDWLHETPEGWIVLDLKTGPAAPWAFGSQVARMSYEVQDAFYSEGISIATGKPVIAFVFGVVETSSPCLSMCGMIDEAGRESGQRKTRKALQDFARCVEKNEWPGYEGVQSISLPRYALDVEC